MRGGHRRNSTLKGSPRATLFRHGCVPGSFFKRRVAMPIWLAEGRTKSGPVGVRAICCKSVADPAAVCREDVPVLAPVISLFHRCYAAVIAAAHRADDGIKRECFQCIEVSRTRMSTRFRPEQRDGTVHHRESTREARLAANWLQMQPARRLEGVT